MRQQRESLSAPDPSGDIYKHQATRTKSEPQQKKEISFCRCSELNGGQAEVWGVLGEAARAGAWV